VVFYPSMAQFARLSLGQISIKRDYGRLLLDITKEEPSFQTQESQPSIICPIGKLSAMVQQCCSTVGTFCTQGSFVYANIKVRTVVALTRNRRHTCTSITTRRLCANVITLGTLAIVPAALFIMAFEMLGDGAKFVSKRNVMACFMQVFR
jgi:hypothetical protein